MVHSLAMDRFDAQFNWKAIMVEPNNGAQSNRWDTNTVPPLSPAARNWFLLQVSDGGWLARGDDIVFCNVMFHQQMATTFITFIFGGRISTEVSKI